MLFQDRPGSVYRHRRLDESASAEILQSLILSRESQVSASQERRVQPVTAEPRCCCEFLHCHVSVSVPAQLLINGSAGEILMWERLCNFNVLNGLIT